MFLFQIAKDETNVPNQVCEKCASIIRDFDDFHQFVLKNQEDLLKYVVQESQSRMEDNDSYESTSVDRRYEKYRCKICQKQLYNKDEYDIHQFYHVPNPKPKDAIFICDICGRGFQTERYLTSHLKQHTTDPHNCLICNKEFENSTRLEVHLVRYHSPCIYLTCDICGRICPNKQGLQSHKDNMHKEKETSKCLKCNVTLKDFHSLQRHNRNKHNLNALRHKCKFCGKGFARKLSWVDHEASHLNLAKYQCEFCEKKFVSNSNFCHHRVKAHQKEYAAMRREQSRKHFADVMT